MVVLRKFNPFNLQTMKKIIFQGLLLIVLFFSTWFVLQQINWVTILRIKQTTEKTEEKLDELLWETIKTTADENTNQLVLKSVDSLITKICNYNDIERSKIKFNVINKNEINAFAMPNGRLVIYSGLITATENQEELTGVLCHEIAHIQLNHVMKKLIKEIGFSTLISITTGTKGSELIKETAKVLSSTSFDRSLEKEADIKAVEYLTKAEINPEHFAHFLYKINDSESEIMKYLTWISTHPDSKKRAEYIIDHSKNNKVKNVPVLKDKTWNKLKELLENQ